MKNPKFVPYQIIRIYPPLIPIFKEDKEIEDNNLINLINTKIVHSPNSMAGEIYEFKIDTFELETIEERIHVLTNYNEALTGTGTSMTMGKYFLTTQLRGEALRKYKLPVMKNGETMNAHLLKIQAGLTKYSFPLNALTKNKQAMSQFQGHTYQY